MTAPLGAGGMGEVWRARDTRLDRDVAVKVLPKQLSTNDEFRQRFEREAKAISQLTHPHICTLHDVGRHDGTDYLVMEFLEGESLAQRLAKGALPLEQTLKIGVEIASALDRAHRAGVVHRDLKPGNVMLTRAGAKLLDFGLAKSSGLGDSDPAAATLSRPLTSQGTIVGTFQYMAPEQLESTDVDARTDIFALGAVLYEMATGHRAFEGSSKASLIAAIMSSQPRPIAELQPMTPPALERLVRKCLAKDPDDRWQSAADVADELRWIAEGGSQVGAAVPGHSRGRKHALLPWALAIVAIVAAVVISSNVLTPTNPFEDESLHVELMPPDGQLYEYRAGPPSVSPDGRKVVFVARSKDDKTHLWLRDLRKQTPLPLRGTGQASFPFWSPDGRYIAFFDGRHLKRVEVSGAPPDIVCEAPGAHGGGTWSAEGVIVYSSGQGGSLFSVSAAGGKPTQVTVLDRSTNEFAHRSPWFLPDGKHFLFATRRGIGAENGVSVGSLDGAPPKRILEVDSNAVFMDPGFVLYWRDGALRGQPFDTTTMSVSGEPFVIAPQTRFEPDDGVALFSASAGGILAFHPGASATEKSQLLLRDRTGKTIGTVGPPGNFYTPRFSHDGKLVAVDNSGVQNNGDIWIYGVDSPAAVRLTFDPADESRPIWSPDDRRIVFLTGKDGPDDLYAKYVNNPGADEAILRDDFYLEPSDWSADGKYFSFNKSVDDAGRKSDIWLYSIEDAAATPLIESPFTTEYAHFAPDGKWIAFESDETGQREVYLQSFPEPTQRRQISVGGGFGAKWRADGKELFYRALDDNIMAVAFEEGPDGQNAAPAPLFITDSRFSDNGNDFDVSPDGQTFVVNTVIRDDTPTPMSLIINWQNAIKAP